MAFLRGNERWRCLREKTQAALLFPLLPMRVIYKIMGMGFGTSAAGTTGLTFFPAFVVVS